MDWCTLNMQCENENGRSLYATPCAWPTRARATSIGRAMYPYLFGTSKQKSNNMGDAAASDSRYQDMLNRHSQGGAVWLLMCI